MYQKTISLILILFALNAIALSQELVTKVIKLNYSKNAAKAYKKGELYNAGFFINKDEKTLLKLVTYTEKKTNKSLVEIQTYDQNGNIVNVETIENTSANLAEKGITSFSELTQKEVQNLKGLEVVFINNPTLAGTPKLVYGSFQEEYGALGVFERYKFKKEGQSELNNRFWAQVFYPQNNAIIERNNYLIQPAPKSKLSRAVFNARNGYMPKKSTAYVGGLMAVSGSKTFLSGILNLENGEWLHQSEITLKNEIYPGDLNFVKCDNKDTKILIPSKNSFTLLTVDDEGKKKHEQLLTIQKTGGQNGVQPSTFLLNDGKQTLVFATTSNGASGKSIGLSVAATEAGQSNWEKDYTIEQLSNSVIQPLKQKLKIKKMKMPSIHGVTKTKEGGYLVQLQALKNTANSVETGFLIIHLSKKGDLISTYPLPAIEIPKNEKLLKSLPLQFIAAGDYYYVIARSEIDGYEKGQYSDVSTTTSGQWITKSVTSFRVDETITAGYVLRINLNNKKASNIVPVKDFILGDHPGVVLPNKGLAIQSLGKIVVVN